MSKLFNAIVICILIYYPRSTLGWGMTGHRVIGKIAYEYLSNKAKKAVGEILGNETMALSSTWADFIRSDSSFNYLTKWHYVDFTTGLDQKGFNEFLRTDKAVDAYTRINLCIRELKNKKSEAKDKQLYLRMLIHMVGDLHMPFHTGRAEDAGGNKIQVTWFNRPSNIHKVWDSDIIDFQQLSYTEYAESINFSTQAEREKWTNGGLNLWLFDSYQMVEALYKENISSGQKLGFEYNFKHIDQVNSQLLKGGIRLAYLINFIFE
jgi:hypothetical protein